MANNRDIFTSTVVPIMDKVRDDLQRKQADEYERHSRSLGALMAGAAGPDGGMAAMDAYSERLYYIGEWNSKTVDDYIEMVKTELKNKGVVIDAVLEKKMIDHLIEQQMPKSTAEYILRKAAEGSIFYLPQRARTTALQDHINNEGDKRHNPSLFEDVTSTILSWASNAASTGGIGGFWGQAALDVAVEGGNHVAGGKQEKHLARQRELGRQEVAAASKQKVAIPKWMLTQMGFERIGEATDQQLAVSLKWANANAANYRNAVNKALDRGERTVKSAKSAGKTSLMSVSEATLRAMQYEAFAKAISNEQKQRKEQEQQTTSYSSVAEAEEHPLTTIAANTVTQERTDEVSTGSTQQTPEQTQPMFNFTGNFSGWNSLLDSIGMSGSGDTFRHLGVTLATLPDMLLGLFTGRTKSLGLNNSTMMPLAALIGGSFIKNPLLKIPLMLYGGASLVNKALDRGERTVKSAGKTSLMSVSEATLRAMQYEAFAKSIGNEQKQRKEQEQQTTSYSSVAEAEEHPLTTMAANTVPQERTDGVSTGSTQQTSEQTQPMLNFTGNFSGWNSLLDSIGMSGSGDTFRHLGVTLATLPDMLLGLFTGRTKSLGLNKSTMMPLAALIGGSFIKNPLLKIPLMLYGGASLVNKVGQEALSEYRQETSQPQNIRYRQYADEELNPRISNPHVEGNVLIVDIDHVPRIVTEPYP